MSNSAERIRRSAQERGVRFLMHFTRAENLPSIVRNGIVARLEMDEREIDGFGSAKHRIDDRDDAVSVSVSAFNPVMFAAKRRMSGTAPWVILLLDPSILWTHRCRFHARNAATKEMKHHRGRLDGPWAFDRMFSEDFRHHRFSGGCYRDETEIPDCLPTRPDAEVQVFDPIDPTAIIHAWADRLDVGRAVQEELNRLPGAERDVTVGPFVPRFDNGFSRWG